MAIELIDKIKQKNNGTFKLIDAIDVEMKDGSDLQTTVDELIANGGGVVGGEHEPCFVPSPTPPENTNQLWINDSDDEINNELDNSILNEFRDILSSMKDRIDQLEAEVEYLKENGVKPPSPTVDNALLTEDGDILITENGDYIVMED